MQIDPRRPIVLAALIAATWSIAAPTAGQTPEPRREDFSEVWTAVRDRFFDPALGGVDWEQARRDWGPRAASARTLEELSAAINGMLGSLDASHTRYYTVLDPAYWFLVDLFDLPEIGDRGYVGIGVFTEEIDGATFVRSVVDGGPAASAGLLVGDRLLSVDGEPWHPILPFQGREGKQVTLRVQRRPDPASVVELTVVPVRIHPTGFYLQALAHSSRRIARPGLEAAYVRVWSYAGEENQEMLIRVLNEPRLAGADGLVLDLRDGWGGASPAYLTLFSRRVPRLTGSKRGQKEPQSWDTQWRKPVVLLVDGTTRSGKEILAHGFRRYGYGPVVGATTAGAVLGGAAIPIGDRALLYLAVTDTEVDGERLEGRGVRPDVEVPFELPYADGADPRLERALEVLRRTVRESKATGGSRR